MKRKLTTIFYADGVGFSALMGADEQDTLARLKRARGIMAELFHRHDGRQVNTWGDAVIAEFPSVVEAVRAAVAVQDAIATENIGHDPGRRLLFRIGINLGDVMVDGDNLYGEGVNVAAGLEALAEPGGIVVSGTVHALARKQLAVGFEYAGAEPVKGHAEGVESWRVVMPGRNEAGPAAADAPGAPAPDAPAGPRMALPEELLHRAPPDLFTRAGRIVDRRRAWVRAQPAGVQRAAFAIALLFAINLLFTGIALPWFLLPSIPFAIYIWRSHRPTPARDDGDVKW